MQPYKLRFANSEDRLTWGGLVMHNHRWPLTRVELVPRLVRYRTKQLVARLPASAGERVEDFVRARRGTSS